MLKEYLYVKEVDGKRFFYITVGREYHYKARYRLWINKDLVKTDENGFNYIEFPIVNCDIAIGKTENTLILRPGNKTLYNFLVKCGYRGSSLIENISTDDEETRTYFYDHYESERGNLGISSGVLILTKSDKVVIKWSRDGRLYGSPSEGVTILYKDGRIEEIEEIDIEEISELT